MEHLYTYIHSRRSKNVVSPQKVDAHKVEYRQNMRKSQITALHATIRSVKIFRSIQFD